MGGVDGSCRGDGVQWVCVCSELDELMSQEKVCLQNVVCKQCGIGTLQVNLLVCVMSAISFDLEWPQPHPTAHWAEVSILGETKSTSV